MNEYQKLKNKLEKKYDVQEHHKADLLFELAWSRGHSCGLNEVELEYDDLVELITDKFEL